MGALRLSCCFFAANLLYAGAAADLARQISEAGLDSAECYRVHDVTLTREDIRLYFTDGFFLFGKPVAGAPVSAVFVSSVQAGDGEMLLLPPTRSERESLSSFTGSPNLNEHFKAAVLLFTDDTYHDLMTQIGADPANRKSPEMGLTLAPDWTSVVRNITGSFETRLVLDLLSGRPVARPFLFAAIGGKQLGNFDIVYDLRSQQQITVGRTSHRDNRSFFDVWTCFESRSVRNRQRPGPSPEFEVDDFRIEATVVPPDLRLQVVTRVKVRPGGPARAVPFELSRRMRVTSARVDGRPAEIFERESVRSNLIHDRGNDLFLLVPAQPLEPGREYEFEFHHEGAVISDAGNKVYAVGSRGNWYPNRGLQFARFNVIFRYPRDLDLVSSGEVVSDTEEGEWKVTRRRAATPVRMVGFNLGFYERAKITRGRETVEVCANRNLERALEARPRQPVILTPQPPPVWAGRRREQQPLAFPAEAAPIPSSPAARSRELAGSVASALEFMSARFGPPPLHTLTVSPVPGAFGQGFPGLIYLSTLSYLSPHERPVTHLRGSQQLFFSELLYAHEVAHQWWGNVIATSGYQHDWLLEALANYSALLYVEKIKGSRALESVLNEYRADLLAKGESGRTVESSGPIALGLRLESSQTPTAWHTIVYEKGSWILHMLRRRMGDERFLSFLAELRRRYQWKSVDTESFRLLAAEFLPAKAADRKLESFFDQWVYSSGVPTLQMKYTLAGKAPALKLTVTLQQSGVADDFSVPVPVEIQFGRGAPPIIRVLRTSDQPAVFTIPVRQAPTKVLLDPGNSVLSVKK
ncbi:MAG TPA: M1 family aminopeptidase [Bryobacteraceae bacterium]|nr:M1 family aminopeptidase [Bryobacteraceae bacterium]